MSLDRKTPKGYRKAWNGGTEPVLTADDQRLEDHLLACRECSFAAGTLCAIGTALYLAAIHPKAIPPSEAQP